MTLTTLRPQDFLRQIRAPWVREAAAVPAAESNWLAGAGLLLYKSFSVQSTLYKELVES